MSSSAGIDESQPKIPISTLYAIIQTDIWADYDRGKLSTDTCYRQLGAEFDISPEELAATFQQTTGSLRPNDEMTALVEALKRAGVAVYIMTNLPRMDFAVLRSIDYIWG